MAWLHVGNDIIVVIENHELASLDFRQLTKAVEKIQKVTPEILAEHHEIIVDFPSTIFLQLFVDQGEITAQPIVCQGNKGNGAWLWLNPERQKVHDAQAEIQYQFFQSHRACLLSFSLAVQFPACSDAVCRPSRTASQSSTRRLAWPSSRLLYRFVNAG